MSQLFGMNSVISTLSGKYDNTTSKETAKVANGKNSIGTPKLSDTASKYYEELKAKYGDMEFVLVDDDHISTAKEQSANINSDKTLMVLISESELEEMATNEETRAKNEKFIEDAKAQFPSFAEKMKESGAAVKSFGMEIKDGTASYFAVIDKSIAAQKERIENSKAEKKADKLEKNEKNEKNEKKKEDLTTVTASSLEELLKKIKDVIYEAKADSIITEKEKMVGQSFDFTV